MLPPQDTGDIGEVIRPNWRVCVHRNDMPVGIHSNGAKVIFRARHHNPLRWLIARARHQIELCSEAADDRLEFKVTIRYVEGQYPPVLEFAQIELERFSCDEVDRYRVGTESVEHKESIDCGFRSHKRQTRVAWYDVRLQR